LKFVLLALAVLTGFAMAALGLPAAFLSGPLLVAAIFSIANRPVIRFSPLYLSSGSVGHRRDAEFLHQREIPSDDSG
jgi:hypothetical protein